MLLTGNLKGHLRSTHKNVHPPDSERRCQPGKGVTVTAIQPAAKLKKNSAPHYDKLKLIKTQLKVSIFPPKLIILLIVPYPTPGRPSDQRTADGKGIRSDRLSADKDQGQLLPMRVCQPSDAA